MNIVIVFGLLLLKVQFIDTRIPVSPCPNFFKYETRSDDYKYGLLTVPSPPIGQPIVTLIALFSLGAQLPTVFIMFSLQFCVFQVDSIASLYEDNKTIENNF